MNRPLKRWGRGTTLLLITVMLAVFTVGCGEKESSGSSSDSSAGGVSGDFEIQYFVGGYGDAGWKRIIEGFKKKYPDVNVKESAGSKINDQMKPRWIQGDPPDFVYIDGAGSNATQMVQDDQLMDLTEYVKSCS